MFNNDYGRNGSREGRYDGMACNPNKQCQEFSKVVATWQTVRHYNVTSYDTIQPVCMDDYNNQNFERLSGESKCANMLRYGRCDKCEQMKLG